MKKFLMLSITVCALVMLTGLFVQQSQLFAQSSSLANVVPIPLAGGRLGLFDRTEGKIYVYDRNLEKCLLTAEVQKLGDPLRVELIEKIDTKSSDERMASYFNFVESFENLKKLDM